MNININEITNLYSDDSFLVGYDNIPIISAIKKKLQITDMIDPKDIGLVINTDRIVQILHSFFVIDRNSKIGIDGDDLETVIYLIYNGYIDRSVLDRSIVVYQDPNTTVTTIIDALKCLNNNILSLTLDNKPITEYYKSPESYYSYRFSILSLANK